MSGRRGRGEGVDVRHLRGAVERACRLPSVRQRYGGMPRVERLEQFQQLPFFSQADLAVCAGELLEEGEGAYLFSSGGTTGEPKLSLLDRSFFLDAITSVWRPLASGDVLLNLYAPGKLWSGHYFYNALATCLGAVTAPVGSLAAAERLPWAQLTERLRVSAVGATPTALDEWLGTLAYHGVCLPGVRAVLWVGEPLGVARERVAEVLPSARLWGLYGSTETWVIGANRPGCDPGLFHPLPHQYVETDAQGRVAVTTLDPRCRNPIVRYLVGDRGTWSACPCGRGAALRIDHRADNTVKFRGTLVQPDELVDLAQSIPGVRAAQVALVEQQAGPERLEIRCTTLEPMDEEHLRARLLALSMDLNNLADDDGLAVRCVDRLTTAERSGKTPTLVQERAR